MKYTVIRNQELTKPPKILKFYNILDKPGIYEHHSNMKDSRLILILNNKTVLLLTDSFVSAIRTDCNYNGWENQEFTKYPYPIQIEFSND